MAEKPNEKILAFCREHNTTPGAVLDGLPALIEAAKQAEKELLWASDQFDGGAPLILAARALRDAINRMGGE